MDSTDILRLRVLLCFLNEEEKSHTVTGISRILGQPKYTVARLFNSLEKEGMLDRTDRRRPHLTAKGYEKAKKYAHRVTITQNHLLYEGVDTESALKDAQYAAIYGSDKALEVIGATEEKYRVKYQLRDEKEFGGALLCKIYGDGVYQLPFIIYREHVKNNNNISMANEGFVHPCTLVVKDGVGTIHLQTLESTGKSQLTGQSMSGRVQSMKYFDSGEYIQTEMNGLIISFPAASLRFRNIGSGGVNQILHGSVGLKIQITCGMAHMPEADAIFTVLL